VDFFFFKERHVRTNQFACSSLCSSTVCSILMKCMFIYACENKDRRKFHLGVGDKQKLHQPLSVFLSMNRIIMHIIYIIYDKNCNPV